MSFLRGTEEYYQKFLELQEKLRKSEEERLLLEMKFNEMVQVTREEEQAYYRKLRNQYKRFLEEDRRRQERNERIMRILERIESRAAVLAAKTERFELLRQQYQAYLQRVFSNIKHTQESVPQISQGISVSVNEQLDLYGHPISQKTIYEDELDNVTHAAKDLYEHPVIKRALAKKVRNPLDSKVDVVKQYLRSLSSPMSGDEILKTTRSSAKKSSVHTSDLTDSNGTSSYRDDVETQEYYKTNSGKIADQIMDSISSRSRFSDAKYNKLSTNALLGKQDRDELLENSFCGTKYSPIQKLSKNSDYVEVFDNEEILKDRIKSTLKDKEAIKKGEVRFQEAPANENDITPDMSEISPREIADESSVVLATSHEVDDGSNYQLTFANNNLQSKNIENYDIFKSNSDKIRDTSKDQDVPTALSNHDFEPVWNKEETKQDFIIEKEVEDTVQEIEEKVEDASDLEEKKYIASIDDTLYDENISQEEVTNFKEEDRKSVDNPELVTHADYDQDQQYYKKGDEDYPTVDHQENNHPAKECDDPIQNDSQDDLGKSNILNVDSRRIQEEMSSNPADNVNIGKEPLHSAQHDDESDQRSAENIIKYQDNGHINSQNNEREQQQLDQNKLNYPGTKYEDNQPVSHYDESGPPAMQYEEDPEPASQYNPQQEMRYDENGQINMQYERGQPVMQYDERGQPLNMQYDESGQPLNMQYDESGQPLNMQYDESGQPVMQYDHNGQPIIQYDDTGRPIMQYDESGQPIGHYDEQGQPMLQYDENGQIIMQYDENGQPLMQYDENGQPILGYDVNGQPIMNYDENGQPIIYDGHNQMPNFDVNGQPLYQYAQNEEYYGENQMYNEQHQNITEDVVKDEAVSKEQLPVENIKQDSSEQNCSNNEQKSNVVEEVEDICKKQAKAQNSPNKERKHNVMEMLDTDTESVRQDTKISNDSDFDFSNN